jgi:hypothetical protein
MTVLSIDPGNRESAFAKWDGVTVQKFAKTENKTLKNSLPFLAGENSVVVIEMIASYGMPVGKDVFETCLFIGQLQQLCEHLDIPCELVYRKDVKMHLCNSMRAKDGNIRQALIDRFGDKGTKKSPGIFYGVSADSWSAIAIAVYYFDTKVKELKNTFSQTA